MKESLLEYHQQYLWEKAMHTDVLSIMAIEQAEKIKLLSEGADLISFIVVNNYEPNWLIKQYQFKKVALEEHTVSQWQIQQWSIQGAPKRARQLLQQADIIFDKSNFIKERLARLLQLPGEGKKQLISKHYMALLHHYAQAKELLQQQKIPDSFQNALQALFHWACLELIEAGELPDEPVFHKVKTIAPTVYKLYEEVVTSLELLDKRIELLLLPIEIQLMAKIKIGSEYIVDQMQHEYRPWRLSQMIQLFEAEHSKESMSLLLDKMVKRGLLYELFLPGEVEFLREKAYMIVQEK
ncbi:hypothetical protein EEL32_03215 [Brevibacillus laterosporus]|uniref:Uncharacterized protein n=1 Tax=Brevibacillus laterosporus TaxID=1465 RepID=A0A502IVF8_BRELA|nr:nucleotidyltransferase-like protein [Brevibacillus laterosporus]QDX92655.1 hypothetical protein EEL30_10170 [Brevibacillus laterosporus]RAP27795.1 hypothetical protein C2W64_00614 [Brevibacillus laterosporus]TPG70968.1 hypothetical protein EEL31_22655 [Brevibacillus laterosporus]TPG90891.1 hypothetical protein EEL32_03215 [Brevibacillus laterosporus]